MADRKPLVLDSQAQMQALRSQDDLDIPLRDQVNFLEERFNKLVEWMQLQGFEIPFDVIEQ
jgi:hypothetical protein